MRNEWDRTTIALSSRYGTPWQCGLSGPGDSNPNFELSRQASYPLDETDWGLYTPSFTTCQSTTIGSPLWR